ATAPVARPFIPMPLPRPSVPGAAPSVQTALVPDPASPKQFSHTLTATETLMAIWGAGFAISFVVLLFGYAHLAWITRASHPLNSQEWTRVAGEVCRTYALPRSPRLLQNDRLSALFTWGWLRPRILVPQGAAQWPIDRIHAVLCHELAHVRRGDWVVQ